MQDRTVESASLRLSQILYLVSGSFVILVGLVASSLGSAWSGQAYEFFDGIEIMGTITTYVPYFPFVPFFPIFLIMIGAGLIVKSGQQQP